MNDHAHFAETIQSSLTHHNYSLLTRRLMDLCEAVEVPEQLRSDIFELRKLYLGSEEDTGSATALPSKAEAVVRQLEQHQLQAKPGRQNNQLVIDAKGIGKTFRREKNAFRLHPLNIQLAYGDISAVVGENGNGKTTLLRLLAGELSSDSGQLNYPAFHNGNSWYDLKAQLGFIPQRINKWHGLLEDHLKFYASIHGFTGPENRERVEFILYRLGLEKFRKLKWEEISAGYRLRFELAKVLLWKPHLLLLDEPLANLDINAQQLLLQDLRFFAGSTTHPMGIIITSQNLHEIERVADRIIFIRQGKTIYNGLQKDFASDREQNSFELSGRFDLETLSRCLSAEAGFRIENSGTSFIVHTATSCNLYTLTRLLEQQQLELNYIRDISQSTRKLFHKDI